MRHLLYNRILPVITFMPVVFGLTGYMLSRVTPMTINMWESVALVTIIICIGIVVTAKIPFVPVRDTSEKRDISWAHMLVLIITPMLVMLPGLLALAVDTEFQALTHSDFHGSLINQIIHGTFPPVNPQVPDYPFGYYWSYHALMAVLSHLFSVTAPLVSVALIYITLFIGFCYLWLIIEELGFDRPRYLVMSALVMILLFNGNLFGVFHAWNFVVTDGLEFVSRRAMVLEGEPRLYHIWSKYINYNSMPLSLMYFYMGIYGVLRMLRGHITLGMMTLISFSIIGGTIFLFVPGVFLGLTMVPALLFVYLIHRLQNRSNMGIVLGIINDLRQTLRQYMLIVWGVTITLLGFLYLSTLILGLDVLSMFPGLSELTLGSRFNLDSLIGVNYPMLPFLLVGVWLAIWKNDRLSQLLVMSTFLGFFLSYIFVANDNNQYKFVMHASLYVGLLTCRVLYYWLYETDKQGFQRLAYGAMMIMLVLIWVNISLVQVQYIRMASDDYQPFEYDGRYVNGTDSVYREMFAWIRENTPSRTLVIQPLEMEAFYTSLYSERLPYVGVLQFEIASDIPEYDYRKQAIDLFYDPLATLTQRVQAVRRFGEYDGDRPMILAIPAELEIPEDQLNKLGFSFAYEVENASLYWFRQDEQFPQLVYVDESQPLNTIFTVGEEESIQLQGIQTGFDDTLSACDTTWVTTWWAVTETPSTDYVMKLVIVNAQSGELIARADAVPGYIPMTQWELDTPYVDTQTLDIPCDVPSGDYQLLVGMYEIDYDTSEFVVDLPLFYQGGSVGTLGFIKIMRLQ